MEAALFNEYSLALIEDYTAQKSIFVRAIMHFIRRNNPHNEYSRADCIESAPYCK